MRPKPRTICCSWFLLSLSVPFVTAEDWPAWRGPRGDGTSLEQHVPTQWSETRNVAWKVRVPGAGHASPIVTGDRVLTVTCSEDRETRALVCFDRTDGTLLWQQPVFQSPLEDKHKLNSFASGTPATDGQWVYVTFLDRTEMVVAAYDLKGQRQWLVRPGEFYSRHGYCSCPVLFEDLVIVNGDHDGDSYLVALKRDTGETVWKVARENKTRSYSTPIIREIGGRTQMMLSGDQSVASYNPRDGSRHWIIDGPTEQFVASVVYNGRLLFVTAGFPERHMLAIRPEGSGNVTSTHIAWRVTQNASYVPSPVAVGDWFVVVDDGGVASCFQAESGRRLWRERLGEDHSASLVTAGGLVYFLSDDGVTRVVRPGPRFQQLAENRLGENCHASPAISAGQIFIRGEEHIWAIGTPTRF